jgi:hypothetical protein
MLNDERSCAYETSWIPTENNSEVQHYKITIIDNIQINIYIGYHK